MLGSHTVVIVLLTICCCVSDTRADDNSAFWKTSFESTPVGPLPEHAFEKIEHVTTGTVTVTDQFAHSGKQSLRMWGDAECSLTLTLPEGQNCQGVTFVAERWTQRAPFRFVVEIQQSGEWQRAADLSRLIHVGARFRSAIRLALPTNPPVTALRIQVTAPEQAGVLLDDLQLLKAPPGNPIIAGTDAVPSEPLELIDSQVLFESGTDGVHTYRIPAIITAANGDLIAACDARRTSAADLIHQRTIDIVYRRSTDNGKTWSPIAVLDQLDEHGCSDPSFILDEVTEELFCFYNVLSLDKADKEFRFYVQSSQDHGATWGAPHDITKQVAGPELKGSFKFVTSGRGIQTRSGSLLHTFVRVGQGVTLFGSADHGQSWQAFAALAPGDESKVVQLHDDALVVNCRDRHGGRTIHQRTADSETWTTETDLRLIDPTCNACILQYTAQRDGYQKDRLLFCNAASTSKRERLTIRISYDGGSHWSAGKVIDSGPSAYSELTALEDGTIGVLYEPGYDAIRFVRCRLESISPGDSLSQPYQPRPVEGDHQ